MRTIAALTFGAGVLIAVRVMFFGVRHSLGADEFRTREWPLAFAAMLTTAGALLYFESWRGGAPSPTRAIAVFTLSMFAGAGARWTVKRSAAAAAASPDPDEDPQYRFQGHVARVVAKLGEIGSQDRGRISFVIDDRTLELAAKWLPGTTVGSLDAAVGSEVVIEHVDDDIAYVEPWALVESRL
jgi:hypothetical protein